MEVSEVIDQVKGIPAIVEGKRDTASLRELGFTDIHELDTALFHIVERFDKGATVQILTDLDKKGKQLYRRLYHEFSQRGVRVDNRLREALFNTDLSHIEGLAGWLDNHA